MTTRDPIERARQVKARHEQALMRKAGVVAVGVGLRERGGRVTNEVCIVVSVRRKIRQDQLDPQDIVPAELEGVPVDVKESGDIHALE